MRSRLPLRPERPASYQLPDALPTGGFALGGQWIVESERAVAGPRAVLRLAFHAHKVFLVLGTSGGVETVRVRVDGRALPTVRIREDRLYTVADLTGPAADHTLDLTLSPGTVAYAFTFG